MPDSPAVASPKFIKQAKLGDFDQNRKKKPVLPPLPLLPPFTPVTRIVDRREVIRDKVCDSVVNRLDRSLEEIAEGLGQKADKATCQKAWIRHYPLDRISN